MRFDTLGFVLVLGRCDFGMKRDSDSCDSRESFEYFSSSLKVRDVGGITTPDEVFGRTLGSRASASELADLFVVVNKWVI